MLWLGLVEGESGVKRADRITALAVLALAFASSFESMRLGLTRGDQPGPGLFPLLTAGGAALLAAFLFGVDRGTSSSSPPSWPRGENLKRIGIFFAALLLYVYLAQYLGFVLSTLGFLVLLFRYPGRCGWKLTLAVSVLTVAMLQVGLVNLLGASLPRGPMGV